MATKVKTAEYELVLMLDAAAPEEARETLAADARSRIEAAGELRHAETWGIRKLAYEIEQRTEADYRFFRFETEAPTLDDLRHALKIADGILRFRIFEVDPKSPLMTPPEITLGPSRDREGRGRGRRRDEDDFADEPAPEAEATVEPTPEAEAPAEEAEASAEVAEAPAERASEAEAPAEPAPEAEAPTEPPPEADAAPAPEAEAEPAAEAEPSAEPEPDNE